MGRLSRDTRLQIMLDSEEVAAIDDWRFKQRMPSRAAAIRELLRLALNLKNAAVADPGIRSQDFGLLAEDPPPHRPTGPSFDRRRSK